MGKSEREAIGRKQLISEPHELYRFLVTPGIEVLNMMFASDEVVWISWQFSSEERVASLRHTNEVIGAFVTEHAFTYTLTWTDYRTRRFIVTLTASYTYSR